jgi:formate hydrogenlyase subunit 3/multisubunit Na+/H+ antiporter MnhD subunit
MKEETIRRISVWLSSTSLVAFALWGALLLARVSGLVSYRLPDDWTFLLVLIGIVGGASGWVRWRYAAWKTEAPEATDRPGEGEPPRSQPLWLLLYSMVVPSFASIAIFSAVFSLFRLSRGKSEPFFDRDILLLFSVAVVITGIYALAASSRLKPRDRWGRPENLRMTRSPGRQNA